MSVQEEKKKGQNMTDLVQVDIDTALAMYSMGETHIRCLQRDVFSDDWTNMQPLYLDEILNGLTIFVSDKRRAELLNPPKIDVAKVKEEIAMTYEPNFRIDPEDDDEDNDPDWTEEPAQVESIPDDDAVPEHERVPYEKPEVITVEQVTAKSDKSTKELAEEMIAKIQAGDSNPLPWNVRDAIRLHDNDGMSYGNLATLYGIKSPQTVINRINHYRMKS